ncbi:MAG TPA: hypothetical protein PLO00_12165, partial [Usitatibacteraceae bacterium]|nr:hypothetical protein [Usitatibacteraceae bacterium]
MGERADADLDAVAFHFSAAGHGDRAAEATLKAAGRAREQLAFARAASLYRRALELLPLDDRRRFELSVALAECLANAGKGSDAAGAYASALREPGVTPAVAGELPR